MAMAMALRSLARKLMPVPAALRRAPPSRSFHHHHEDKLHSTTSPKTTTHTGKGSGSYFEDNPELFAELVKLHADNRRRSRMRVLFGASAYCVVFFTLLYLRNREKHLLEEFMNDP